MWPSGQSTRAPCAVERDALRRKVSTFSPGMPPTKKLFQNNSYAHDKQGDNPAQEKKRARQRPL